MNYTRLYSSITDGLIKAMVMIAQSNSKPKGKPKYSIVPEGQVVHATRCLSSAERAEIMAILKSAHYGEDLKAKRDAMRQLAGKPIHMVPFKRATLIDRSRYSGDMLRQIRKQRGCGRPWRPETALLAAE